MMMEGYAECNTINVYYTPQGASAEVTESYTLHSFTLRIHEQKKVALLQFNQPKKMNPFRFNQRWEYHLLLTALARDDRVKAVVLAGAGKAFSAGADFAEGMKPTKVCHVPEHVRAAYLRDGNGVREDDPVIRDLSLRLLDFPKPLLCAVNGMAVGISANFALLMFDMVFAVPEAKFLLPFVSLGVTPEAGSTLLLTRRVGPAVMKEILYEGGWLSATRAKELGLVNALYEPSQLIPQALARAENIATKSATSLRLIKKMVNGIDRAQLLTQFDIENEYFKEAMASPEFAQAMMDFMSKHGGTKGSKKKKRSKL